MLAKRIIPCLDIKNKKLVKGTNFEHLQELGDAVDYAIKYDQMKADEIVFLDITASIEKRKNLKELVSDIAQNISIPFTVGGGINSVEDAAELFAVGADKVSVNSAAIANPSLINQITDRFGSQACVVAIDAKQDQQTGEWICYSKGGKVSTGRSLYKWAREAVSRGAGEILFTSIDHDGVKHGFANAALATLAKMLPVPVIASGGAGRVQDFYDAFVIGKADAALAASTFHYGIINLEDLKNYLLSKNINIRL